MADVYVTINAPLGPMDRGDRFEDPLCDLLDEKVREFEVTGGGTSISKSGGVSNCDIDLAFQGEPDEVLPLIIAALEKLGAPKGSVARVGGKEKVVKFGTTEGLGVHLAPPDEAVDLRGLIDRCNAGISGAGEYWTGWTNPSEAVLCFYGPSAARLRELLTPVLETEPLAHGCRFEPLT